MSFKLLLLSFFIAGCAQLHHIQVGDVETHSKFVQKPFEILISEMGFNIGEVAGAAGRTREGLKNNDGAKALAILSLFQMGPITGNPVYVKDYAKNLMQVLYEKCPSGNITGLMSIRETRKYPVISGEIVKVKGFCLIPKGA